MWKKMIMELLEKIKNEKKLRMIYLFMKQIEK